MQIEMPEEHSIGQQIRSRRKQFRLTQAELADLAGVAVRTVHEIEHDKPSLRLDSLRAVLEALGLELTVQIRKP